MFLAIVLCAVVVAQKIGDPYKILGVHRKASLPEIRKAYRQLAKEWYLSKKNIFFAIPVVFMQSD